MTAPDFILTVQCPDRTGIIAGVSGFLADQDCFITRSRSFGDRSSRRFFLRLQFSADPDFDKRRFEKGFQKVVSDLDLEWRLYEASAKVRTLIMLSRTDHCANALLYGARIGDLPIEPAAIISNHEQAAADLAHWRVPVHIVPVTAKTKPQAEARMFELKEACGAELVVLARYMQVLSEEACARLAGACINIHHAFLPGFKGARPYHRAHERGVKVIGATAHYVTPDLDEGPIISQVTEPVSHVDEVSDLVSVGRKLEADALTRAVKAHAERRVFLNGAKTVVFP
ncbi:MAG: formyltetrahydrofolate deformylase [Pseudomonadota bacterium]